MTDPLIPTRFLFHFAVPCRWSETPWGAEGAGLDASYSLPVLAELEPHPTSWQPELRAGWNHAGIYFSLSVSGKRQPPWCRATRPEDSDGLQLWLDTRNVHSVHRAGRFCHRFFFMPTGAGARGNEPAALMLPINRARENPKPAPRGSLRVLSQLRRDGYRLDAMIAAEALTGFDPAEHPRLGFTFAVLDRELGERTFTAGSGMPYQEDPSLWATLDLHSRATIE